MKQIDINKLLNENSYCISIKKDNYAQLTKVFSHYQLPVPKLYEGVRHEKHGRIGCTFSHTSLVMMAKYLKLPYVLIFEDDAYPCKDIINSLNRYLSIVPDDCGILVLGHYGIDRHDHEYEHERDDFCYVHSSVLGSHAYIVFENCYDEFLTALITSKHVDSAIHHMYIKDKNNKIYATSNILFVQHVFEGCINHFKHTGRFLIECLKRNYDQMDEADKEYNKDKHIFYAVAQPPVGYEDLSYLFNE